ncbi:MAG: manganese-binding transcriptional regulator MntR [Planctomycetes bacterium]|nr:manganese-binding transcriptional regulator MntR [Planctomycetota bacterium]
MASRPKATVTPASADTHRRTREDHAAETAQDYAEAVADLIEAYGEARVTDLARLLGVSHVTVVRTVARLQREELLSTRPYRSIFLTTRGKKLADEARRRHLVVLDFLLWLGVGLTNAQRDAEGIEHHVSAETLAAMERICKTRGPRRKRRAGG